MRDNTEAESSEAKGRSLLRASQSAFVADGGVVKQHGQSWGPVMKGALPAAHSEDSDAAMSAWAADLCGKTLGKELPTEDKQKYAPPVRVAQECELAAWFPQLLNRLGRHFDHAFDLNAAGF